MLHKYKLYGQNIVLDIYSGSVHVVSDCVYDILDENKFDKENINKTALEKYTKEEIDEALSEIDELIENKTLYSEDIYRAVYEVKTKNPPVKALCLHMAHDCDLRCRYCFAGTGAFHGERSLMSEEVAKKAIDFVIKNSQNRSNIEIDFFGGEPMLNFDVVKKTVDYAEAEGKKHGKNFRFTITTNGNLINDTHMEYINKHMSNIVLSCDGRKEINDKNRKTLDGKGTYDIIIDKFKNIADSRNQMNYYVRGTFTKDNLDFANDVIHLADLGFKQISVEPVALPENSPLALGKEDLPEIFSEYERLGEEIIKREKAGKDTFNFFHFMIDLNNGPCALKRISGCGAGCEYLSVTPSGDIYPCHQFAGEKNYLMGNVLTDEKPQKDELKEEFKKRDIYHINGCDKCFSKFYCSGGCAANSAHFEGNLYEPYKIGCELQRKRTEVAIAIKAALL